MQDIDPIPLARDLIRKPSVTPADAGVLAALEAALTRLGFACERMKFGEVDNLYARRGRESPNFCFAGHLDVVPVGDAAAWTSDPFGGDIRDGWLCGRGASDMKAAIAAMVAAVARFDGARAEGQAGGRGSISFLITLDEEGPALDGTRRMLETLAARGETIDHCIVGEPTSTEAVGDVVKNGRRGSLNAVLTVEGKQGHAAYPQLALNPVPILLDVLASLRARRLDDGAPGFDPSNLEITTIDVGNPAHNVIPARASAKFNIRFNTHHSGATLSDWLADVRRQAERAAPAARITLDVRVSGEPFYTPPSAFTAQVAAAVEAVTGATPELSTSGGTSDARFIKAFCPVAELGLQNASAHMVDERVLVEDVRKLAAIYAGLLERYFA